MFNNLFNNLLLLRRCKKNWNLLEGYQHLKGWQGCQNLTNLTKEVAFDQSDIVDIDQYGRPNCKTLWANTRSPRHKYPPTWSHTLFSPFHSWTGVCVYFCRKCWQRQIWRWIFTRCCLPGTCCCYLPWTCWLGAPPFVYSPPTNAASTLTGELRL